MCRKLAQFACLSVFAVSLAASSASAQTLDWDVEFDFDPDAFIKSLDHPSNEGKQLGDYPDLPGRPEPAPKVEAFVDPLGLVIIDTDASHRIYVLYTPDFADVDVVVYEGAAEVYRRRFARADVEPGPIAIATAFSGGLCRIYCRGGDDTARFFLQSPARIFGGDGDDDLRGGDGADVLYGGSGNDTLRASWNWDALYGEAGDDVLLGGRGFDFINGGDGDDLIDTKDGFLDYVLGGAGRDVFYVDQGELLGDIDYREDVRY